jgi:hypothetical protein
MTLEKNDVDISRLFIWGKKFEIYDDTREETIPVYMRLLGDADVNRARVHALRKSRELRLKLQDPNSDESLIYIKSISEMAEQELVSYIVMFSLRDITNRAYRDVKVEKPKMPKSDAALKKMEKFQKEIDDFPARFDKAVKEFIKKETDALRAKLEKETKEVLYKKYVELLADEFCEQEALRAYRDMEMYLGCYRDEHYSERFWDSFGQFENLDTGYKQLFRTAYETLDIKMDELKKLREATQ